MSKNTKIIFAVIIFLNILIFIVIAFPFWLALPINCILGWHFGTVFYNITNNRL